MTASLETLVIAAYVFADSLPNPRSGPAGKATDSELIALSVAQAILGISSDRQFMGMIRRLLGAGRSRAIGLVVAACAGALRSAATPVPRDG